MYLCWRSSSLHRYLSSLWALSWAFSNVIWAAAFTYYIYLDAPWCPICVCLSLSSFWAWFWAFPTGIWAIPYTTRRTQTYLYLCWCSSSLHRYLSSLWALSWVFPMWFELLPLHTTYTLMHLDVLYVFVWAHFELGLELFPLEFELFHAQKNIHEHMCAFVGVLHHYIDIWAHFELCLEFFPMWFELLPLHTTYTLVSYTCSFELILSLILVFPHWNLSYSMHKKTTQTYVYLCWLSASLHPYLSSLWALSWAFSSVIWAAAFTYYIYLDASWCPICVCLSAFCAWFWAFPNGIWGIPCTKNIHKHMCAFVGLLTTSVFELTLSSVLSFFRCEVSCCLYILHIPWCPIRVRLNPFWAWFWACSTGIWAISCRKKNIHKHMCAFVGALHHYIGI